jgi:Fe-S-cluster containining protein
VEKPELRFRVLGEEVRIAIEPLPPLARVDQTLPVLRALDDKLVAIAITKHPEPVTCARGCSACCRIQPVPVTPAEALSLSRLIDDLPNGERERIFARFDDCEERLASAGLKEIYLHGIGAASEEEAKSNVRSYLDLRLACPFLTDDGACGIYESRPFVCREYCVSSPSELCEDPLNAPVRTVRMIMPMARASLATTQLAGMRPYTLPLTLARAYVELHRDELEREHSGDAILHHTLRAAALSLELTQNNESA